MLDVGALEEEVWQDYLLRLVNEAPAGRHILILGHPSSGKSTAARELAATSSISYVYDSALLELPRFGYYTGKLFKEQDWRYYFPYEVEAVLARFLQNIQAEHDTICDQGMHSIWAYARALCALGRIEPRVYQSFFALFLTLRSVAPWPRLVIRFRCDSSEAWRRVIERNRNHEPTALSRDFIAELDRQYEVIMADFPHFVMRVTLDTTQLSKEQVLNKLRAIVDAPPT